MAAGCLECETGFAVDPASARCITVPPASLITNCLTYASDLTCSVCAANFFWDGKACSLVPALIANCVRYGNNGTTCVDCSSGYAPSVDAFACLAVPRYPSNCVMARQLECSRCIFNALPAPGRYLDSFRTPTNDFARFYLSLTGSAMSSSSAFSPFARDWCVAGAIKNCARLTDLNTCGACPTGYYLNSTLAECKPNPVQPIEKCISYLSYTTCAECANGYMLQGRSACVPVSVVQNCDVYDGTIEVSRCKLCKSAFYLKDGGCIARVQSANIANCNVTALEADLCASCNAGYALTTDGKKCLGAKPNCQEHGVSSVDSTDLTCVSCIELYFLDPNSNCAAGTIANCRKYATAANTCVTCANGYYLSNNACLPQPSLQNCNSYSLTNRAECSRCVFDALTFTYSQGCALPSSIANCRKYGAPETCEQCIDGYALSSNACTPIPLSENCVVKKGGCVLCRPGYLLIAGACRSAYAMQQSLCAVPAITGVEDTFTCSKCAENSYPLNYKGLYICVKQDELAPTFIPNCLKHTRTNNQLLCTMCASGYYVSENASSCLSTCNGSIELVKYDFVDDGTRTKVSLKFVNRCIAATDNCKVFAPHTLADLTVCVECMTGSVPIRTITAPTTIFDTTHTPDILGNSINSVTDSFLQLCFKPTTQTFYPGNGSPDPNCASWYRGGNEVFCNACLWGMTGSVNISPNGYSYVVCSSSVDFCETGTKYGGFSINFLQPLEGRIFAPPFVTCHKCQGNRIPFFFYNKVIQVGLPKPFGISTAGGVPEDDPVKNGKVVMCLEPIPAQLGISEQSFTAPFPSNCAMGQMMTDQTKRHTGDSTSVYCSACLPKYRPMFFREGGFGRIGKCIPIDNCAESNLVNACGICATGYTWMFDTNSMQVRFDFCTPLLNDPNCAYVSITDLRTINALSDHPSANCYACRKGFSFNADGICERIVSPKCAMSSFSTQKDFYTFSVVQLGLYLNFVAFATLGLSDGCSLCETGFVAVKQETDLWACTASSFASSTVYSFRSKFIYGCRAYALVGSSPVCVECSSNTILSFDKSECVQASLYPNCEVVSAGRCSGCSSGYVLTNGLCVIGTVPNCRFYTSNGDCAECNEYYKVRIGGCVKGDVLQCRRYSPDGVCAACNAGFWLVEVAVGQKYCLANLPELNCDSWDASSASNGIIKCNTCREGYARVTDDKLPSKSLCISLNRVNDCIAYDILKTPLEASLTCTACPTNSFYLSSNTCMPRTRAISNCLQYNPTAEKCQTCNTGFFSSPDGRACIPNPDGLIGCEKYRSHTSCESCLPRYYLEAGVCKPVTVPIVNCLYYNSSAVCGQCVRNHIQSASATCTRATALNCLTFANSTACATCAEGYGLEMSGNGNVIDCAALYIANCAEYTSTAPYRCSRCEPLYYPLNGMCVGVAVPIVGCIEYVDASICGRCNSTSVLSVTRRACLAPSSLGATLSPTCESHYVAENPSCAICQTGFYLNSTSRECQQCLTPSAACLACDYADPAKCLVCQTEYDMIDPGVCTLRGGSSNSLKQASIVTSIAILIFALLLTS